MRRIRIALVALAGAVALAAVPAGGAVRPAYVKNTNGWIEALAMDGPLVAYDISNRYTNAPCNKLLVWNVLTGYGAVVGGRETCDADSTSTGAGVRELAVAGNRIAWIVNQGGNTESDDYLYSATLPKPKEHLYASAIRTGDVDGTLTGGWIGGLVGSGDRIVVNRWTTNAAGGISTGALERLGAGLKSIASGTDTLTAGSLDHGRVAILRDDGSVVLRNATTGKAVRTFASAGAKEVALYSGILAVLTKTKTLAFYDTTNGKLLRTVPVAGAAAHLDFDRGLAVYAVGRKVYIVRVSDGKDRVLAAAPRAVEALHIEAPGVVYAYNTVKGIKDVGNLAFVPRAKATSFLG